MTVLRGRVNDRLPGIGRSRRILNERNDGELTGRNRYDRIRSRMIVFHRDGVGAGIDENESAA